MAIADPIPTSNMTDQQRAWFYAEYEHARRDEVIGVVLAIFLGGLGLHQFYLRRTGLGILYLCFCWTGVPVIAGWVDAFFMPRRVREFNAQQAALIAGSIYANQAFANQAPAETPCLACGGPVETLATFCPHCGNPTSNPVHARQGAD